ncbi:creatininase family protein [Paenibacillaceae bacterium]|nr:creatininase family protein [Paenibacillaceae bacterium]
MFQRYEGKVWEDKFLPRLSYRQIRELPKEQALLILPIGAVEQHGDHMPVMTDSLIGEAVLTRTMEQMDDDSPIWLLPPISYGKSNEHLDFPGTISLSASTLENIILDIARSVKQAGFRRLLLFNTHGGNADLLNMAAREVRIQTGLMVFYISAGSLQTADDLLDADEKEYGIHAGDYETSLLLAIKPGWVHTDRLVKEMPNMAQYDFLTMEGKIRFAWVMSDLSSSGVLGDATKATADKGELILQRIADALSQALEEVRRFEITDVKQGKVPVPNGD